jgi:sugar phosphate isomerase/epimerase
MSLFWTTAGVFPGKAAAKAGFKGMGIWHSDLEHILLELSLKDMGLILDDNGIEYLELEFLTDWFLDGAKQVKVGDFDSSICPMPRLIESFSALCPEAEDYGTTIGFEFMASSVVAYLRDSLTLVEGAGACATILPGPGASAVRASSTSGDS